MEDLENYIKNYNYLTKSHKSILLGYVDFLDEESKVKLYNDLSDFQKIYIDMCTFSIIFINLYMGILEQFLLNNIYIDDKNDADLLITDI